ncbi:MAG: RNHCP domain-containing protein [Ruminococcaceae bacterium]|nr:RNHCP domain-containing protein [Oscillospiraceae bacterium]
MNRENKKRSFEKGCYKTHPCTEPFTCKVCGRLVTPDGAGSEHRNHCPNCLSSQHLDNDPGDRSADCGGVMEPIAVWVRKNGEWAVIHRCRICGALSSNRIAADDNPMKLISLAMKPIALPPFPLERIEEMTRLMGGDGEIR